MESWIQVSAQPNQPRQVIEVPSVREKRIGCDFDSKIIEGKVYSEYNVWGEREETCFDREAVDGGKNSRFTGEL